MGVTIEIPIVYSTVTDFAKFLGISTLHPLITARLYAKSCNGMDAKIGKTLGWHRGISMI